MLLWRSSGGLAQSLAAVTREKYSYAEFLRRFAVAGEAMEINDDEFDYISEIEKLELEDK